MLPAVCIFQSFCVKWIDALIIYNGWLTGNKPALTTSLNKSSYKMYFATHYCLQLLQSSYFTVQRKCKYSCMDISHNITPNELACTKFDTNQTQGTLHVGCRIRLTLTVLVTTIDSLRHLKQDNNSTVRGDGGSRVGEVRAGTTSPMPEHKGFMLQ